MKKVYIEYAHPDSESIVEVWSDGTKPKLKKLIKEFACIKVYDEAESRELINERLWDGLE